MGWIRNCFYYGLCTKFASKYDLVLDIDANNIVPASDTISCLDHYLSHSTRQSSAQRLSADCDLDIGPSDMVVARNTLSCYDYHLCQIIFKSHLAIQSYEPDTNRLHRSLCTKVNADCDLDL